MNTNKRTRGYTVYPFTDPSINGPLEHYALATNESGQVRMIHTEGVAYEVRASKPWRWSDYWDECPTFTVQELQAIAAQSNGVDLADWVREFGARLETNFSMVAHWMDS